MDNDLKTEKIYNWITCLDRSKHVIQAMLQSQKCMKDETARCLSYFAEVEGAQADKIAVLMSASNSVGSSTAVDSSRE
jgi:hypothetical protein